MGQGQVRMMVGTHRGAHFRGLLARGATHVALLPTAVLVGLFLIAPLALVVLYSFGTQKYLQVTVDMWPPTFENYQAVIHEPSSATIVRSLGLAAATAIICLVIGYPFAYLVARKSGNMRNLLLILIIVPFWAAFLIRTYAWVTILAPSGPLNDLVLKLGLRDRPLELLLGWDGILIGMVSGYLPLMVFPLYASLEKLDDDLLEAAADLGASKIRVFLRVILPDSSAGIFIGLILVGAPATAEYVVPQILGGGKTLLLGNLIGTQFGSSFNWPLGSALAVIAMVELAGGIYAMSRLIGRRGMRELV